MSIYQSVYVHNVDSFIATVQVYNVQSLAGHTSPVDAVKFSSSEDVVIAGSLSGALKLWDLESVKSRRSLMLAVLFAKHLLPVGW